MVERQPIERGEQASPAVSGRRILLRVVEAVVMLVVLLALGQVFVAHEGVGGLILYPALLLLIACVGVRHRRDWVRQLTWSAAVIGEPAAAIYLVGIQRDPGDGDGLFLLGIAYLVIGWVVVSSVVVVAFHAFRSQFRQPGL